MSDTNGNDRRPGDDKPSWTEEVEVAGEQLVQRVKELAAEGQVRRIIVKDPDGNIALDIPLTVGAIAGGAVVIAAPVLAVIGALAALVTKVNVEIVRDRDDGDGQTD